MNIEKSNQKNAGGIVSVSYVLSSEVVFFPDMVKFRPLLMQEITLAAGAGWKIIYFTAGTCSANSDSKKDDAGTYCENSISFEYPAENEQASVLLEELKDVPILVLVKNLNGTEKLFGTPRNPMKLQYNQQTGETVMKSTGYNIAISGAGIHPAIFIKR